MKILFQIPIINKITGRILDEFSFFFFYNDLF